MNITLDLTVYRYCCVCGNSSDKEAEKCNVCKNKDPETFIDITESQEREIFQQKKDQVDKFNEEIF